MGEEYNFTIKVPCDDEGFVLLQCPRCGELFKLRPDDYESDEVLEVCCPSCGGASDSYLTDEVFELAIAMAKNKALEAIHGKLKNLEKNTRGKAVSFRVGGKPKLENETDLFPSIDALSLVECEHCRRESKVSRLLKMSAFVCPLCGVNNFNER